MQHEMRLTKGPFEKVQNGTKVIESRLFDSKRKLINPGDEILFRLADDETQKVRTRVIAIFRYRSFKELMTDFPASMFGGDSTEDLLAEIRSFYSEEEEKAYGVVGVKVERM